MRGSKSIILARCPYDGCGSGKLYSQSYSYTAGKCITYEFYCMDCARVFSLSIRLDI